jgi:hypothetical protein
LAEFGNPRNSGNREPDKYDDVANLAGLCAAFLSADPLFEATRDPFLTIAIANYGREMLEAFEWAYWIFLHIAIFAITREATRIAITAIITAGAYRLAF